MFLYALKTTDSPSDRQERIKLLHSFGITHLDEFEMTMGVRRFKDEDVCLLNPHLPPHKGLPFKIIPTEQTWHDAGRYYIGYSTPNPPVNQAFKRKDALIGVTLNLTTGEWELPVLPISLPNRFAVDQEGNPYRRVAKEFHSYLALAEKYWDLREANLVLEKQLEETEDKAERGKIRDKLVNALPEDDVLFADAVKIIQLNYAVSTIEVGLMEWLSYSDLWAIIYHCIHAVPVSYAAKKNPLEIV